MRRSGLGKGPLGELERYGVLATAAGGLLIIGFAVQRFGRTSAPVHGARFLGAEPLQAVAAASPRPADLEELLASRPALDPEPVAPGARLVSAAHFDFFEPPLSLPGLPRASAAAAPAAGRSIVVRKDDTLSAIAGRELGSAGRWLAIVAANPGVDPRRLQEGQILWIPEDGARPASAPPAGGRSYVVRRNDTLEKIAARELGDRRRWTDVFHLNRDQLRRPKDLKAGATLKLPAQ